MQMNAYKDNNNKIVGEITVIAAYFRRPDETLSQFMAQLKPLTAADKTELAIGVAKEMGWSVTNGTAV